MQIDNINTLSLLLSLALLIGMVFLLLRNYIAREKLKQIYKLLFDQNRLFYLRYIFLVCSLLIISLGIFKIWYYSNPLWDNNKWLDVVFVLDVSKSMNTRDVKVWQTSYSTLEYSKEKIAEYMSTHPRNRYALVIFAWDGISISPLTNNLDSFLSSLARVSYTNIGEQWSDLAKALELGYTRFGISESDIGKALILISDGWDDDDAPDLAVVSELNKHNIPTQILWIWSSVWWPIPMWADPFWNPLFQMYQWERVITKLNKDLLKDLARSVEWEYDSLVNFDTQLDNISKKALQHAWERYKQDVAWVLGMIAALLFILYLLFPYIFRWKR